MRPLDALEASLMAPRRFTLDEYHQLLRVGVLKEDEHVELLEGLIVDMTPQGRPHALVISRLNRFLSRALGEAYSVRPQLPLSLGPDSEPEPDLAIVTREEEEHAEEHPRTALLVVEVAVDSLRVDRLIKGRVYARAGIPEYWVVDVAGRLVEVYTAPVAGEGRYLSLRTVKGDETLAPSMLPGLVLHLAALFS
jgi:Uma2 family endonuclease